MAAPEAASKPGARRASKMNLLRDLQPHQHARVGFIELFFDLVFVFAVTQLSHTLLEQMTFGGAFQAFILFMAVWWAWIDTAWVTNWLDPQKQPVRLMLLVVMLAGLVLSTSLPEAFGERSLYFASAYAFIQIGRSLFTMLAFRGGHNDLGYRNFQRIASWHVLIGALWIAGAIAGGDLRLAIWIVAILIELAGPLVRFWTPWHGRSDISDWRIEGGHMAERCALFIIIALGESILSIGGAFASIAWTAPTVTGFAISFVGSVALWWIYFDSVQERGSMLITRVAEPGRLARNGYTYIHIPIVAGIVVSAVADEIILLHPAGELNGNAVDIIVGGPALYLLGTLLFRWAVVRRVSASMAGGLVVLALLFVIAPNMSPLMLGMATTLVVVGVALSDWLWPTKGRKA